MCWQQRTRDVGIENVIFLDHIVYELLAVFVHNEDLPLEGVLVAQARRRGDRTSPRVVCRMVLRMTAYTVSW